MKLDAHEIFRLVLPVLVDGAVRGGAAGFHSEHRFVGQVPRSLEGGPRWGVNEHVVEHRMTLHSGVVGVTHIETGAQEYPVPIVGRGYECTLRRISWSDGAAGCG